MLLRLQIENLALIEHAELEPGPGLNVLTGETGAGKTMLAQAIGLVAAVFRPGLVGPHGAEAYVEAEFGVPPDFWDDPALEAVAGLRPDGEDTLIVARRLTAGGRSMGAGVGPELRPGRPGGDRRPPARGVVAARGPEAGQAVLPAGPARRVRRPRGAGHAGTMAAAWSALRDARSELEAARVDARELARRRASSRSWRPGSSRPLCSNPASGSGWSPTASGCDTWTTWSRRWRVRGGVRQPRRRGGRADVDPGGPREAVADVERFDPSLESLAGELRDAAVRLQEAAIDIGARLDALDADPGRLEELEGRLQLFTELERRFGAPVEQLVDEAGDAREALERLDREGERTAALEQAVAAAGAAAKERAAELSAARRAAAEPFARAVEAELDDLGMSGARLDVGFEEADLGARGADAVTLRLAANSGLPAQPLAQVASGGELSRIALAIRVAAGSGGGPETLLLDEVDAGVGGRTARAVERSCGGWPARPS